MSGPDGMLSAMAVCQECQREMLTALSCTVSTLYIGGNAIPVKPFGPDSATGPDGGGRCGDCGVQVGGFHHLGCDMQRCPRCRRQLLSCGCSFDEFGGEQADEDGDDGEDDAGDDGEDEEEPEPSSPGMATENPCPRCGSTAVIPILYGMPSPALAALSEQGHVELAGCVFDGGRPSSRCRDCDHAWSRRGAGVLNQLTH